MEDSDRLEMLQDKVAMLTAERDLYLRQLDDIRTAFNVRPDQFLLPTLKTILLKVGSDGR